jgi:beta-glucosidase
VRRVVRGLERHADATGPTRPVHELRGFAKVELEPDESVEIVLPLTARDLSHWNAREKRWQVQPGSYRVEVGASSRDIRLTAPIHSDGDATIDPLRLDSTLAEWAGHPAGAEIVGRMRAGIPSELADSAPELAAMLQSTP